MYIKLKLGAVVRNVAASSHLSWQVFAGFLRRTAVLLLTSMMLVLAVPAEAHAYTDPGSGALIWQLTVAAFVGAMFYLRKMLSWLQVRKKAKKD